jgi:hypothetical protein
MDFTIFNPVLDFFQVIKIFSYPEQWVGVRGLVGNRKFSFVTDYELFGYEYCASTIAAGERVCFDECFEKNGRLEIYVASCAFTRFQSRFELPVAA